MRNNNQKRRHGFTLIELLLVAGILAVLVLAGCASPPERTLSANSPTYAALPNGFDPLKPTRLSAMYAAVESTSGENAVRHLERKLGRPLNILSISGGGQNGAFGAGFLKGWRESGRRPKFDAVGGVSTGALLATHALRGTPADDHAGRDRALHADPRSSG